MNSVSHPAARTPTGPEACAEAIIDMVGKDIRLAMPLGLGKANRFANALYSLAAADRSIRLRIYTALSLETPRASKELERRFLEPYVERAFAGYPALSYASARRSGDLPPNIEIEEFFLAPGSLLTNDDAQRSYNCVNYTHALRRILRARVNVVAQMIARRPDGGVSLSCNPDMTLDLLASRARGDAPFAFVGEINERLPFMANDAEINAAAIDFLVDGGDYTLFSAPAPRVSLAEHAIGVNAALLVKDGGTLQIGIGALGDAVAQALLLRHEQNALFRQAVLALKGFKSTSDVEENAAPFSSGVYGCSEMVTQGLFELLRRGVVVRPPREGSPVALDGGFFLGPKAFYDSLNVAPQDLLAKINMTAVSAINQLYGDEEKRSRERVNARFINIAMKATALGALASDALEDGRVVSGVGGQYNFVAQAHALAGARSVMLVRSTRLAKGRLESNIVWSYGHTTIPRHLRDIVVTEYGIADLRDQPDEEVVKRMIAVCDARFQDEIVQAAKKSGKLAPGYAPPESCRRNTPENLKRALQACAGAGAFPPYPFGADFTSIEQDLAQALLWLKNEMATKRGALGVMAGALTSLGARGSHAHLQRLSLDRPSSLKEVVYRQLVDHALRKVAPEDERA